jgi:competence protein ComFA
MIGRSSIDLFSASHVLLPGRYHGHALPVPEIQTVQGLNKHLNAGRTIKPLIEMIKQSLEADRQVFLFVPRIDAVERMLAYLQAALPEHAGFMAGVHASDSLREEKVLAFRAKTVKLMVTTTILERGVTIPGSDVVVVGAQAPVFDEASLVQIAGRVGRSADDPCGTVLFVQEYRAKAPRAAVRQITRMNQLAKQLSGRK